MGVRQQATAASRIPRYTGAGYAACSQRSLQQALACSTISLTPPPLSVLLIPFRWTLFCSLLIVVGPRRRATDPSVAAKGPSSDLYETYPARKGGAGSASSHSVSSAALPSTQYADGRGSGVGGGGLPAGAPSHRGADSMEPVHSSGGGWGKTGRVVSAGAVPEAAYSTGAVAYAGSSNGSRTGIGGGVPGGAAGFRSMTGGYPAYPTGTGWGYSHGSHGGAPTSAPSYSAGGTPGSSAGYTVGYTSSYAPGTASGYAPAFAVGGRPTQDSGAGVRRGGGAASAHHGYDGDGSGSHTYSADGSAGYPYAPSGLRAHDRVYEVGAEAPVSLHRSAGPGASAGSGRRAIGTGTGGTTLPPAMGSSGVPTSATSGNRAGLVRHCVWVVPVWPWDAFALCCRVREPCNGYKWRPPRRSVCSPACC